MPIFGEFDLTSWERVGFVFKVRIPYEGKEYRIGEAKFGDYEFSLQISGDSFSIASVDNRKSGYSERHSVSEVDAVKWFGRLSVEFEKKWKSK